MPDYGTRDRRLTLSASARRRGGVVRCLDTVS